MPILHWFCLGGLPAFWSSIPTLVGRDNVTAPGIAGKRPGLNTGQVGVIGIPSFKVMAGAPEPGEVIDETAALAKPVERVPPYRRPHPARNTVLDVI